MPFLGVGSGKINGSRLDPISPAAIAPKKSAIVKNPFFVDCLYFLL